MTQSLKERLETKKNFTCLVTGASHNYLINPDGPEAVREIERLEGVIALTKVASDEKSRIARESIARADFAEARVAELEAGLKPFAALAAAGDQRPKDDAVWGGQGGVSITYGDLRHTAALLKSQEQNNV